MQTYKLIKEDYVLLSQPILVKEFGRSKAQFLSQLHYWISKGQGTQHENLSWIFNTVEAWADQLQLSVRQIKRIIKELREKGVIFTKKLSLHKSNQTNYYSINYERLKHLSNQKKTNENVKNHRQSPRHTHSDMMTPSKGQNDPLVIQRITNKDYDKSEFEGMMESQGKGEGGAFLDPVNQDQNNNLTKIKNTTSQDMVRIWNKVVCKSPTSLTKELAPLLVAAFKQKFNACLNKWEHYCQTLTSSEYMMGKTFDLNLKWALKFATIERVRAGGFGVKEIACKVDEHEAYDQALKHIERCHEESTCQEIRRNVLQAFGAVKYNTWFQKVRLEERAGEVIVVPPSAFVAHYIEKEFGNILQKMRRGNNESFYS